MRGPSAAVVAMAVAIAVRMHINHEGRRANSDARDRYLRSKRAVAASTFAITFVLPTDFFVPRGASRLCAGCFA
eukprot:905985-Prymnesium_polylepis.1